MAIRHVARSLALGGALLLAALPLAASAQGEAQPDGRRPAPSIAWTACEGSDVALCGTLQVPVDWSRARGQHLSLAVARRPADDPRHRVGTLFYNPGGPGDGGVAYVIGAERYFSATLLERFDLVAMDPRGIGASTPIACDEPIVTPEFTLWPRTEQQFDALVAHNRAVGQSCLDSMGPLLGHVDTVSVARDHEALRRALHVRQVSWLGISYGTQVAANYAELFPRKTRAMALDAALEHSLPEVLQVAGEIRAVEDSFNRFARWCGTDATCALRGLDVAAVFDALVAAADRSPMPVEGAIHAVTGEDIRLSTIGLLTFPEPSIYGPDVSWAGLSRALRSALDGDATPFAFPAGVPQTGLQGRAGNGCMDYVPQVHTWRQMQERIVMGKQLAPHLQGASETWWVNGCIGWPVPVANPPRLLDVRGVPALIVHATHDPSLPYEWAHSLAAQIAGSRVLTREGDGHTSYYTSACARAAIDAFLVDLTMPEQLVCD